MDAAIVIVSIALQGSSSVPAQGLRVCIDDDEAKAACGEHAKARRAWVLDNFEKLFGPFAKTLNLYPAGHVSVLTGAGADREPISAIHPNAAVAARNDMIAAALECMCRPGALVDETKKKQS